MPEQDTSSNECSPSGEKKAVVIRFGVYGDAIMVTPVLRELKRQGYYVIVYGFAAQECVYRNNPNIDELYIIDRTPQLLTTRIRIPPGARVVDLQDSVERQSVEWEADEEWVGCKIHRNCYKIGCNGCRREQREREEKYGHSNFYEGVLIKAGLTEGIPNGELFFSRQEMEEADVEAEDWPDYFIILWLFSSTTYHKQYPHWYQAAEQFCAKHPDARIYTIGDENCKVWEVEGHSQIIPKCGQWDIRKSFALLNLADLVVGGETGPMCAAGCFDTPKVVLMSNSAPVNLVKHWTNVTAVSHNAPCQPCHQFHFKRESCPTTPVVSYQPKIGIEWPICSAGIKPQFVLEAMEQWYHTRRRTAESRILVRQV